MRHRLRTIGSYAGLMVAFAIAAIWIHSYAASDALWLVRGRTRCELSSWRGLLHLSERCSDVTFVGGHARLVAKTVGAEKKLEGQDRARGYSGSIIEPQPFSFRLGKTLATSRDGRVHYERHVTLPHWFVLLFATALAVVLRPHPRWRFGLRDLFAFSTIVAVVAAGYTLLSRLAGS
ncbi:hypothetical protein Pla108_08810 [Botrimarina colliarenosi]|uniref:Uncharacterized protein n=1 Tax=Botrimarina colliarenosi TaxID=2528001 RepID=A0A5C6AKA7_9BACT|nr:hypothetical protein [Botrimarina colliarenosi]TWT99937.1 hypothetical protein Pla108_08810 [Botrimarina colliarenosi]